MRRWFVCAALALPGCYEGVSGGADSATDGEGTGDDGPDSGDDGNVPGVDELCNGEDPSITPLRRMSVLQYENTVRDLLGEGAAAEILPDLEAFFADLPPDGDAEAAFANMDLRISQRHVNNYYMVADGLANGLLDSDARLADVAGDCATSTAIDDGCIEDFIVDFGLRAYRRPLTDDEVELYRGMVDPDRTQPEVIRDLVFVFLMSPRFLYHFETEGVEIDGRADLLGLTAWEIASRLSYHFWQSMPDQELFDAAADGSLTTEEGYEAQVDRILADESGRLRESFRRFYADWYRLDAFSGFAATAAFQAFADGQEVDYADMVAEIEALTDHYTWDTEGTMADMVLSDLSFTQSPDLARIYGVEAWNGQGTPPTMPAGERSGLLTRAAFLVTGDEGTAPLHRGAWLRAAILCQPIDPPDPNVLPADALDPPPLDPSLTTRERYEAKTAAAECAACHALFNPIGFAQEAYDALGRYRTEERIFDDTGALLATVPIDTSVTVQGLGSGEQNVNGPVELMNVVVDTGDLEACFARHYFEYTYRRAEQSEDECIIEELGGELTDGSIQSMLRQVALQPEFRVRKVEGE